MRGALAEAGLEPLERAAAAVRAYALSVGTDPRRARISFVEIVGVSERVERRRDVRRQDWITFFREEIRAILGPDVVPPGGFELAATGFIGALTATVHRWSLGDPPRTDRGTRRHARLVPGGVPGLGWSGERTLTVS
ncbi:MAG: hypothetical protein PGN29_08835 [Gordonia paraffinivorans]